MKTTGLTKNYVSLSRRVSAILYNFLMFCPILSKFYDQKVQTIKFCDIIDE